MEPGLHEQKEYISILELMKLEKLRYVMLRQIECLIRCGDEYILRPNHDSKRCHLLLLVLSLFLFLERKRFILSGSKLYTHLYILRLIHEQDPIEMIDLVLHDTGRQSLEAHGVFFSFWIQEGHLDPTPALNITTLSWNR